MTDIKNKMVLIQSIFIDSKERALSLRDYDQLVTYLNKTDTEFISLAYEAASMSIAIKSIEESSALEKWLAFYQEYGKNHAAQIHVGLGWALSELNLNPAEYILNLEPIYKYRVIDGFGYHQGRFKRRQAVRTQQIPTGLDKISIRAYNQGLGRSFWYTAQGEPEKLSKLIAIFPEERHLDMWRGVGVALAYVGGINLPAIADLLQSTRINQSAFKCGIALAIQSRVKANTSSKETENISKTILGFNCPEISEKLTSLEKEINSNSENFFFDWISKIEQTL